MRALWYDVFNAGKSLAQAPADMLKEENDLAWKSNVEEWNTRFFNVIQNDSEEIAGAVVHLCNFESYEALQEFVRSVPWIKHGFATGKAYPFTNFISVQKLFNQGGKYAGYGLIHRKNPFCTSPTITWYVILAAKSKDTHEKGYGIDDALHGFRLLKSNIAEEVFDLQEPERGLILRLKANDKLEVEQYLSEFSSVRDGAVEVVILRTKSTSVWDFTMF